MVEVYKLEYVGRGKSCRGLGSASSKLFHNFANFGSNLGSLLASKDLFLEQLYFLLDKFSY